MTRTSEDGTSCAFTRSSAWMLRMLERPHPMRVGVFGLGYVGSVTAAMLARNGHHVVGVDTNPAKVQMMNAGLAPVIEPGLGTLLERMVSQGRLTASS